MADVRLPLLAATLTLLVGCLGDVPTGGNTGNVGTDAGSGDAASMAWTTSIAPIVTRCTTGTSCHAAPSLQNPKLTSFADFKASTPAGRYLLKPGASNIMVTKAMALGTGVTTHQGVAYLTMGEQTTFATFIDTYGM